MILIDDGVNLGSFRFIDWRPAKAERETAHKTGKCLEKFHEIRLFTSTKSSQKREVLTHQKAVY